MQSRFYDPAVGRFINADALVSTGQDTLGYNMFAYCGNDPVNNCDPTGDIPILDAYIHREVLKEISNGNSELSYTKTCIRYRDENKEYTGKWGFCDLYNTSTGEVWELKKNSDSKSCRTENAIKQLDNYVNGTLLWTPVLKLKKPDTTQIPGDTFPIHDTYFSYNARYWNEDNGILRYDYSVSVNTTNVVLSIIAVGIIAITGSVSIGAAGMLLPA